MALSPVARLESPLCAVIPPYMQDRLIQYYEEIEKDSRDYKYGAVAGSSKSEDDSRLRLQSLSNKTVRALRAEKAPSEGASHSRNVHDFRHGAHFATRSLKPSPREVWDASNATETLVLSSEKVLPGVVPDAEAHACFTNTETTDKFFRNTFKIYCVNTATKSMKAYTHYASAYNNAFWHPVHEKIFFGNVDNKVFNPFVLNQDVTIHEFGHAAVHYYSKADLNYENQSGALNESISDVFAAILKQNQAAAMGVSIREADWTIGNRLIVATDLKNGTALRSMSNPGKAFVNHPILKSDAQVGNMHDYINAPNDEAGDWGGVHLNSGIPNAVFYNAAMDIGEYPLQKIAETWFKATQNVAPNDTFAIFAARTIQAAQYLKYGPEITNAIAKAWGIAGVNPEIHRAPMIASDSRTSLLPFQTRLPMILGAAVLGAGVLALSWSTLTKKNTPEPTTLV